MLASKVSRAVQRICPSSAASAAITAVGPTRGTHQRRRSSSKASCPPDDSSKPTPAAKADVVEETTTPPIRKRAGKYRRLGDKAVKSKKGESTLPSVPDIQHLDPTVIAFSSFFSLHRPLSLTNPLPPSVTEEAFNAIFDKAESDPWANGNSAERRPEDVIYALSQTIESLENESQEGFVHIDGLTDGMEDGPARHLDSLPKSRIASLEEAVAQYQPFRPPPPPQSFTSPIQQDKKRQARQRSRTKRFTTTVTVTQSMVNGETRYEASLSPIVQLPDAADSSSQSQNWLPLRKRKIQAPAAAQITEIFSPTQRRTQRLVPRRPSSRPSMHAISVKRQRRLKMSKHKQKKLRRRDRAAKRRAENR